LLCALFHTGDGEVVRHLVVWRPARLDQVSFIDDQTAIPGARRARWIHPQLEVKHYDRSVLVRADASLDRIDHQCLLVTAERSVGWMVAANRRAFYIARRTACFERHCKPGIEVGEFETKRSPPVQVPQSAEVVAPLGCRQSVRKESVHDGVVQHSPTHLGHVSSDLNCEVWVPVL